MDNNEKFEYTYSAKQQAELENIRKNIFPRKRQKWISSAVSIKA